MNKKKYVGRSIVRKDGEEKVKGSSIYTDDIILSGLLFAGVYRSNVESGKIIKLGIEKAKKVPGVKAVLTYKDIPGRNLVPVVFDDQPLLVEKRIRYYGEPIALIAAESYEAIEEAKDKIEIEVEKEPRVITIEESIKKKHIVNKRFSENIFQEYHIKRGGVKEAFQNADLIIKNKYSTNYQEHAYLETQSMVASHDLNGRFSIFGSMQCPFYVQEGVATILGIDLSRVTVNLMTTGGAFGGKEDVPSIVAEIAALLSYKTKKPVKYILSREEDISVMSKRHPAYIEYESAFSKNGALLGVKVNYYLDAGAYSTLTPIVLWRGVIHAIGPYTCDAVEINGYGMATNKVPCGAYRGFGTPQIIFAGESQMDIAAEKLGIDPVKIREINAFKKGDITATGQKLKDSIGIRDTIRVGKKEFKWSARKDKIEKFNAKNKYKKRGIGAASMFYGVGLGARGGPLQKGSALISISKDGSVQFAVGTTEMGQGMYTVLSQIAADYFGISVENVSPSRVTTEKVSDSGPTVASRATFISGNAIKLAAERLKSNLIKFMIKKGIVKKGSKIEFKNEKIYENGRFIIGFKELSEKAWLNRVKMIEASWYLPSMTTYNNKNGQGDAYVVYSYTTNFVEIEVDLVTYRTTVISLYSAEEFGKAINPTLAEGQIEGGTVQGIGYSLYEDMILEGGKILSNNFSTYLIPTIMDIGELKPIIVEKPFEEGPFGAKGMGEMPLMAIAPAIGNAIYSATKKRLFNLPLRSEDLYNEFKNK
jgi:CO/xanthine dehydrogenase Mo-binding subunit